MGSFLLTLCRVTMTTWWGARGSGWTGGTTVRTGGRAARLCCPQPILRVRLPFLPASVWIPRSVIGWDSSEHARLPIPTQPVCSSYTRAAVPSGRFKRTNNVRVSLIKFYHGQHTPCYARCRPGGETGSHHTLLWQKPRPWDSTIEFRNPDPPRRLGVGRRGGRSWVI